MSTLQVPQDSSAITHEPAEKIIEKPPGQFRQTAISASIILCQFVQVQDSHSSDEPQLTRAV
jgi:hypothetical protein